MHILAFALLRNNYKEHAFGKEFHVCLLAISSLNVISLLTIAGPLSAEESVEWLFQFYGINTEA